MESVEQNAGQTVVSGETHGSFFLFAWVPHPFNFHTNSCNEIIKDLSLIWCKVDENPRTISRDNSKRKWPKILNFACRWAVSVEAAATYYNVIDYEVKGK